MWMEGRQGSGYFKKKLLESKLFKFDVYLLKYPVGSYINKHTDPVKGYKHYRLNISLNDKFLGGAPNVEGKCIIENNFFYCFRPDLYEHSVNRIEFGTRYVLSIGWLKRDT